MALSRHSEPLVLQLIWKTIEVIRGQRQIANIPRITKIIQRDYSYTAKEIMLHLLKAVRDNMVIETVSLGCKGSKSGLEQEGYWIPEDSRVLAIEATHDWYCFLCHKPGVLLKCTKCVRAYHSECINKTLTTVTDTKLNTQRKNVIKPSPTTVCCKSCQIKEKDSDCSTSDVSTLNKCLGFIASSALENAPDLGSRPNPEDYMHYNYFIREHINLKTVIAYCSENSFKNSTDFLCMIELIVHNCTLLHGEKHKHVLQAKEMLQVCVRELKELDICMNCYYLSSAKPTADWFSTPCNPPHRVVWAKQKGFEYWPAKVIQVQENRVDVRFFGGHHERAWVTTNWMRSIMVSPASLQIKITKGWKKANEEMKELIRQTESIYGSDRATEIVSFEYNNITQKSGDAVMQKRAAKRKKEKDKTQIKAGKYDQEVHVKDESPGPSKMEEKTEMDYEDYQIKVIGQKAKLDEECARTWPHSLECIEALKMAKYKEDPNVQKLLASQVVETKQETSCNVETQTSFESVNTNIPIKKVRRTLVKNLKTCNCKNRYGVALARYKSMVQKMRRQEQNKLMTVSALCIQHYTKKYETQNESLEQEISFLKSENERLKLELSEKNE